MPISEYSLVDIVNGERKIHFFPGTIFWDLEERRPNKQDRRNASLSQIVMTHPEFLASACLSVGHIRLGSFLTHNLFFLGFWFPAKTLFPQLFMSEIWSLSPSTNHPILKRSYWVTSKHNSCCLGWISPHPALVHTSWCCNTLYPGSSTSAWAFLPSTPQQ